MSTHLTTEQEEALHRRLFAHIRSGGNTCYTAAGKRSEADFLASLKELTAKEIPQPEPAKHGALLRECAVRASH